MKLRERVCIITGAASGIGKEIALPYAALRAGLHLGAMLSCNVKLQEVPGWRGMQPGA